MLSMLSTEQLNQTLNESFDRSRQSAILGFPNLHSKPVMYCIGTHCNCLVGISQLLLLTIIYKLICRL